jgi:hypothetical protein
MIQTATAPITKAIFQAVDPGMQDQWLSDARADLIHPVVVWRWAAGQWHRLSPVVELKLARRWVRTWSSDGLAYSITPCQRLSRPVTLWSI